MTQESNTVHRITKNQSIEVMLDSEFLTLDFANKKSPLKIEALAQWQHVFQNKEPSLTTRMYLYDSDLYNPQKPSSTARKLLGQNEVVTIGSIRNPLYLGKETDVSYLDPEHLQIELLDDTLRFKNLSKKTVTITVYQKEK